VSARAPTGAAPVGIRRCGPVAGLALFGGGVLLVEAVFAALFGPDATRISLLLAGGGVVALGAARLVPAAPRLASLLCGVAVVPAAFAYLPLFVSRLDTRYSRGFPPTTPTLGGVLGPLLAWLLATAPLACAAVLAWRQARSSSTA